MEQKGRRKEGIYFQLISAESSEGLSVGEKERSITCFINFVTFCINTANTFLNYYICLEFHFSFIHCFFLRASSQCRTQGQRSSPSGERSKRADKEPPRSQTTSTCRVSFRYMTMCDKHGNFRPLEMLRSLFFIIIIIIIVENLGFKLKVRNVFNFFIFCFVLFLFVLMGHCFIYCYNSFFL